MDEQTRIIEIDGVKLEIDLRHAKQVDHYRVGDNIKVMVKEYQDYKSYVGTIIGFDNFEKTPSIVIAYLKTSYADAEIKIVNYYAGKEDFEIAPLNEYDIPLKKSTLMEQFDNNIAKKEQDLLEARNQKEIFQQLFGKYFNKAVQEV